MTNPFTNITRILQAQKNLIHDISEKLKKLNIGGGPGPSGTVYAEDVVCENDPTYTTTTNAQSSIDELYAYIDVIDQTLDSIL